MASLRGRLLRVVLKHTLGRKLKRIGSSVSKLRKLDEFIIKNQKTPAGTEISPVQDQGIAAEWVRAPGAQTERAILYLHGGAFVMCSPATHRELAARLSAAINTSVLVLDYRLAPEHPFPAAMEDAVSAYRWLLDKGHKFYADETTATLVEVKYYLQALSMSGAPTLADKSLRSAFSWMLEHEIEPGNYLDPIQRIPIIAHDIVKDARTIQSGHLVPLDRGGKHEPTNAFLMLPISNQLQGNLTLAELLTLMRQILARHEEQAP